MNTAHTIPAVRPPSPRPGLTIRVICAWCDRPLNGDTQHHPAAQVSHGICRPCAQQHFGLTL